MSRAAADAAGGSRRPGGPRRGLPLLVARPSTPTCAAHPQPEIATADLTVVRARASPTWGTGVAGLALLDPPPEAALDGRDRDAARAGRARRRRRRHRARPGRSAGCAADPRLARALLDGAAVVGRAPGRRGRRPARRGRAGARRRPGRRAARGRGAAARSLGRLDRPPCAACEDSLPAELRAVRGEADLTDDLAVGPGRRRWRTRTGSRACGPAPRRTSWRRGPGPSSAAGSRRWPGCRGSRSPTPNAGRAPATRPSAPPPPLDRGPRPRGGVRAAGPRRTRSAWRDGRVVGPPGHPARRDRARGGDAPRARPAAGRRRRARGPAPRGAVAAALVGGRHGAAAAGWPSCTGRSATPWPDVADDALLGGVETWLGPELARVRGARDLRRIDVLGGAAPAAALAGGRPARRAGAGAGRRCRAAPRCASTTTRDQPVLAVRIQEVFGWRGRARAGRRPGPAAAAPALPRPAPGRGHRRPGVVLGHRLPAGPRRAARALPEARLAGGPCRRAAPPRRTTPRVSVRRPPRPG